jgi:predicted MFS family arabinose efflux permease
LLATLLLPRLSRRVQPRTLTLLALSAGVVVLGLLVVASSWWIALAGAGLWGVTSMCAIVNGITVRQLVTPEHLQGRVSMVGRMLTFGLGQPVGALAGGVLADLTTVRTELFVTAVPLAIAAVLGWLGASRIRPGAEPS